MRLGVDPQVLSLPAAEQIWPVGGRQPNPRAGCREGRLHSQQAFFGWRIQWYIHTWYEVRSKLDLVYYLCKESSRVSGTCTKHYVAIGSPPNLTDQKKSCRKLVKCWDASRLWSMSKIAHRTICFDLPQTILSHPWKPGKFTLLVYRELTTWENDKRKKHDNVILGNLKRYGVFIQPHVMWSMHMLGRH